MLTSFCCSSRLKYPSGQDFDKGEQKNRLDQARTLFDKGEQKDHLDEARTFFDKGEMKDRKTV